ncbi:MAG: hypothetical protein KGL39_42500 [Patescibacteria group bacterium]|nr:hypothetical protein [Patescibacteria group bacterium]
MTEQEHAALLRLLVQVPDDSRELQLYVTSDAALVEFRWLGMIYTLCEILT